METPWKRWAWPLAKGLLAVAILVAIGRKFQVDLQQLDPHQLALRPAWLLLSGMLYLLGLFTSAWYWHHLMHVFGDRPTLLTSTRAYFMGHLGKYVPGKAWALLLRGSFVRGAEVRFGVAIITSFYEVLTTMASGGMAAAIIFAIDPPEIPGFDWHPLLTSLLFLALCGVPLLPGVFNFLVGRMARRFEHIDSYRLPRLRPGTLLVGIVVTGAGWPLLGLGVWSLLQGMLHDPPDWSIAIWMQCTASIGLAYVAGFLVVFVPGGFGAREYFLSKLLAFANPSVAAIDAAVLMLRLVWTIAEVVVAAALLGVRHAPRPAGAGSSPRGELVPPERTQDAGPRRLEDSPSGLETS
jgi:uncharacterized membrane protein YbhN (UPF0104 family)